MEQVQKLPFVFMQTLYLYIKDRVYVYRNIITVFYMLCQTDFIFPFDGFQPFSDSRVFFIRQQLF